MKIGRIYATEDGESHIGELDILLAQNKDRPDFYNSTRFAATAIGFQHVRVGGATACEHPPQRWLAFILVGTWEIEASDGSRRQFSRWECLSRRRHDWQRPSRPGSRGRECACRRGESLG